MKKIAQCDPLASYLARKDRIDQAMREVCEGGFYILGRRTAAFEEEFAAFCGARRAIGVANGTDAIELVLRAMELPPGSFVATVSNTAVATVSAIERAGCRPLFVDIDEEDFTISPDALEEVLKSSDGAQVKAVVAVHLFGHPADVERLRAITEPRGIRLIEDCAQAHGASVDGRRTGSSAKRRPSASIRPRTSAPRRRRSHHDGRRKPSRRGYHVCANTAGRPAT
jgi:dTDP-4-amino-4,6-dideoxygalactose transaminase